MASNNFYSEGDGSPFLIFSFPFISTLWLVSKWLQTSWYLQCEVRVIVASCSPSKQSHGGSRCRTFFATSFTWKEPANSRNHLPAHFWDTHISLVTSGWQTVANQSVGKCDWGFMIASCQWERATLKAQPAFPSFDKGSWVTQWIFYLIILETSGWDHKLIRKVFTEVIIEVGNWAVFLEISIQSHSLNNQSSCSLLAIRGMFHFPKLTPSKTIKTKLI